MSPVAWTEPDILLALLLGAVGGLVVVVPWLIWRHRQHIERLAAELENTISERTLELQITLQELAEKNQELETQSTTDALSGVKNRAYFDRKIQAELNRSRREQRPLALILLDIDFFKHVNDEYGHLAGDQVIRQVAGFIQSQLKRCSDLVCRYGGEEFALILPNTDITGALQVAERIRSQLAAKPLPVQQHQLAITISAGCYAAVASSDSSMELYIHNADKALYQAKNSGRNQVISSPAVLKSITNTTEQKAPKHAKP
ncbi:MULTISPECIES: GGDEF domain-containing protein [Alkalimonas]|uniref:diguanylate cyclase n=1 Tax=Alkalimonas mucilaginosa TaxID=3057676 RepID=A0ABU7JIN6_9GAMM|nr:GGDEF domain-containing protein [Alkalimonas sp. MEB004]MEE2025537.1 GGDEF domain-containing protein [Alkalimonas sp. MEB004]